MSTSTTFHLLVSVFHSGQFIGKDKAGTVPKAAVCILFIHHVCCFISLVIACGLVELQIVTVGSEQGDKWRPSARQTAVTANEERRLCTALQWMFSLFLSVTSLFIYPSTHLSIHPAIALQGRSKERSHPAAHPSLWWTCLLETHQLFCVPHQHKKCGTGLLIFFWLKLPFWSFSPLQRGESSPGSLIPLKRKYTVKNTH